MCLCACGCLSARESVSTCTCLPICLRICVVGCLNMPQLACGCVCISVCLCACTTECLHVLLVGHLCACSCMRLRLLAEYVYVRITTEVNLYFCLYFRPVCSCAYVFVAALVRLNGRETVSTCTCSPTCLLICVVGCLNMPQLACGFLCIYLYADVLVPPNDSTSSLSLIHI